jgi:hypothetical protein
MNNYYNPPFVCTSGSYTGDSSANKPIAHGLGRIPKLIVITKTGENNIWTIAGTNEITFGSINHYAETAMNTTNFYVGNATSYTNSANWTGNTYYWTAI